MSCKCHHVGNIDGDHHVLMGDKQLAIIQIVNAIRILSR